MRWPAQALIDAGYDVVIYDESPMVKWAINRQTGARRVHSADRLDGDVLVFQRPTNRSVFETMPKLQQKG